MSEEPFDIEDAIHELGVLLADEQTGLMVTTMQQNFYEKYERFELEIAWECFVSEINRVEKAIERAFEEKPYPSEEDIYRIYAELEKELENE